MLPLFKNDNIQPPFKNDPSIYAIQKYSKSKIFRFKEVKIGENQKKTLKLDKTKILQKIDVTTRIIKKSIDIFAEILCSSINGAIKSASFPYILKLADIKPLLEKRRKDMKENFRPVSILPTLFFDNTFSNQQYGFQKGYSTRHGLRVMLETWKRSVDKGKVFGALLTDLSKAFDCIDHELLTAKLNAYGVSLTALRLVNDYLSNRKQIKN